ncbi:MAG: ABC transporter ATP-binding protein [Devosiaceae bacterium]|nr:ABC transporter ATP-binding protein [Devosiaceae bacterium MH13]
MLDQPSTRTKPTFDESTPSVIRVRDLEVGFGETTVLQHLDLDVRRGEILGFVGASGTGKSVLLRAILGLNRKRAGTIEVLGQPYSELDEGERTSIDQRLGVLFQHGALFSSLNVIQNVQVPMREHWHLDKPMMKRLAAVKLALVGLPPDAALKNPSELSGGMIKRVALARALALDPDVVFLDEPTSGLDPLGASAFDDLIADLRDALGLTVFMVTHDLDSLFSVCDRVAVLGQKKVLTIGTVDEVRQFDDPWVQRYFNTGRAAER